jgi:hypothetical protein
VAFVALASPCNITWKFPLVDVKDSPSSASSAWNTSK